MQKNMFLLLILSLVFNLACNETEVETNPTLTEADYMATGEGLTRGLFGLAQLTLDHKAWEPSPAESKA